MTPCTNGRWRYSHASIKSSDYNLCSYDTPKSLGVYKKTSQTVTGQIIRFNQVTKADVTGAKGGFYNVHIRGVIEIGGDKSGASGSVSFESTVLIQQTDANKIKTQDTSTLISANTSTNPDLLKIVKIQPSVSLSQDKDGYGIVSLAVTCSGTSDNEPVIFVGQVELLSKFPITQSTLFD